MEEEPPSGLMDQQQPVVLEDYADELCDIADEEVHFSREPPAALKQSSSLASLQPRSLSVTIDQMDSSNFLNNNISYTDIGLTNDAPISADSDRLKSSRILNKLATKLRRGSNYLIAPKLVGQYLLGITIQNWSEFLNTSRMLKAPSNAQQLTRRLITNLNYFQGNYLCVSLILIIYCILTSPLLLIAILAYLMALYLITARSALGRPLIKLGPFKPNLQQQYSFVTLVSLPLLWVAGAPSAVFWVIGASFVVVGLHASMYNNERLMLLNSNNSAQADHQSISAPTTTTVFASNNSTIQHLAHSYYNHHHSQQYLSVPNRAAKQQAQARKDSVSSTSGPLSNSYANAISQWITFNKFSPAQNGFHSKLVSKTSNGSSDGDRLVGPSEVVIISQDYAGLGRVYEI